MARVAVQTGQIMQIAGVSQLVEIDYRFVMGGEPVKYKIGADKTCATCDKNHGEI
ncbi:hypothetical protein D3C85_1819330 [compost metagenome]